jgi:triosephosphate isomerase
MARRKLIAANWKMYKTIRESEAFVGAIRPALSRLGGCDLLIFPPFFSVPRVSQLLAGTGVSAGAQDLSWEDEGAFTGEISGAMIRDTGATHVLVGHSERRHVMGEGNDVVSRKLRAALRAGLTPVLCVGERIEHRAANREQVYVREQLETALAGLPATDVGRVVVAYEPVWAIGTGRTATPADAVAMHAFVRTWILEAFDADVAERLRILYGGSVKPENASGLLAEAEIDGGLVGGASLDPGSFLAIAGAAVGGGARRA